MLSDTTKGIIYTCIKHSHCFNVFRFTYVYCQKLHTILTDVLVLHATNDFQMTSKMTRKCLPAVVDSHLGANEIIWIDLMFIFTPYC